jgi:hypothetical protein
MEGFAYEAPTSVAALRSCLSTAQGAGEMTQILAGGTDLLVQMKQGNRAPPRCRGLSWLSARHRSHWLFANSRSGVPRG